MTEKELSEKVERMIGRFGGRRWSPTNVKQGFDYTVWTGPSDACTILKKTNNREEAKNLARELSLKHGCVTVSWEQLRINPRFRQDRCLTHFCWGIEDGPFIDEIHVKTIKQGKES